MGGRRGYGPTHSQSFEKFLLGIDNTMVCAISSLHDPRDLIDASMKLPCPKIIIENKADYSSRLYQEQKDLTLGRIGGELGTLRLSPDNSKSTLAIISYGHMAQIIANQYEYIFKKTDTVFTLLCPQLLHPLPIGHFIPTIKKCLNVLIVEEGTESFGWADGVLAKLVNGGVNCRVNTLSSDPVPIPSKKELEDKNIVSVTRVIDAINRLKYS
jgi:2-oxoisovalerate dehydrogenase E1 component